MKILEFYQGFGHRLLCACGCRISSSFRKSPPEEIYVYKSSNCATRKNWHFCSRVLVLWIIPKNHVFTLELFLFCFLLFCFFDSLISLSFLSLPATVPYIQIKIKIFQRLESSVPSQTCLTWSLHDYWYCTLQRLATFIPFPHPSEPWRISSALSCNELLSRSACAQATRYSMLHLPVVVGFVL